MIVRASLLGPDPRGSVAGLTFKRGRSTAIVSSRPVRSKRRTARQAPVRAAFTRLVNRWTETLSPEQRQGWIDHAGTLSGQGGVLLGSTLTGQTAYVRANLPRLASGLALIGVVDDPPFIHDQGQFDPPSSLEKDVPSQTLRVTFDSTSDWANESGSALLVAASRQQSESTNRHRTGFGYAGAILGDDTTPPTSPAVLPSPFALSANTRTFGRLAVSRRDGRLSTYFRG